MRTARSISILLACAGLWGCGGGLSLAHTVPQSILDGLSPAALAEARQRAGTVELEKVKLENARAEAASARLELVRAKNALNFAGRRLEAESDLREAAEDDKVETQVRVSTKLIEDLERLKKARKAAVKLREAALEAAEHNAELAQLRLLAAQAQVEAARAEAVAPTVEGAKLDRSKFSEQTADWLKASARAESTSGDLFNDVKEAQQEYDTLVAQTSDAKDADVRRGDAVEQESSKLRDEVARLKERVAQLEAQLADAKAPR